MSLPPAAVTCSARRWYLRGPDHARLVDQQHGAGRESLAAVEVGEQAGGVQRPHAGLLFERAGGQVAGRGAQHRVPRGDKGIDGHPQRVGLAGAGARLHVLDPMPRARQLPHQRHLLGGQRSGARRAPATRSRSGRRPRPGGGAWPPSRAGPVRWPAASASSSGDRRGGRAAPAATGRPTHQGSPTRVRAPRSPAGPASGPPAPRSARPTHRGGATWPTVGSHRGARTWTDARSSPPGPAAHATAAPTRPWSVAACLGGPRRRRARPGPIPCRRCACAAPARRRADRRRSPWPCAYPAPRPGPPAGWTHRARPSGAGSPGADGSGRAAPPAARP